MCAREKQVYKMIDRLVVSKRDYDFKYYMLQSFQFNKGKNYKITWYQ